MELKIVEQSPTKLITKLVGANTSLLQVFVRCVQKQKNVTAAAFSQDHPLSTEPLLIVETDGKGTPKQALAAAAEELKKEYADFDKQFKKTFA